MSLQEISVQPDWQQRKDVRREKLGTRKTDAERRAELKRTEEALGIEFVAFPKIPRFRDMIVTEKIDGTNAAVGVRKCAFGTHVDGNPEGTTLVLGPNDETGTPEWEFLVYAQSRKRLIAPGKQDNAGFAGWVAKNAVILAAVLGEGLHFGEWWGSGIQRGYGLPKGEKRFSLFNTHRWEWLSIPAARVTWEADAAHPTYGICYPLPLLIPAELGVVPVIDRHAFTTERVEFDLGNLLTTGSIAAPGFMNPEGLVVYLPNSNRMFKKTLGDDGGKFSQ